MVSLGDIQAARERIAPYVIRTPLHPLPAGPLLKRESSQVTGAFKAVGRIPEVAAMFVTVSAGGLISAMATAVKALRPTARVVGVEPAAVPPFARSRAAGKPVVLERADTIADGLRVLTPGRLTWEIVGRHVDEFTAVSDEATLAAVRQLLIDGKVVVEPSGAVAVAAALSMRTRDVHAVAVVSGGNADPQLVARLFIGV